MKLKLLTFSTVNSNANPPLDRTLNGNGNSSFTVKIVRFFII